MTNTLGTFPVSILTDRNPFVSERRLAGSSFPDAGHKPVPEVGSPFPRALVNENSDRKIPAEQ